MTEIYHSQRSNANAETDCQPTVSLSVVTATYRRPNDTSELVESISKSVERFTESTETSADSVGIEVLICCKEDDAPTVGALRSIDWDPLEVITTDSRSASRNRNVAIRRAEGEYVVSVDSDCVVAPDWIRSICDAIVDHEYPGAVQGAYYHDWEDDRNWFTEQERKDDRKRFEDGQADSRNLVLKRDVYRIIDGYDTRHRYAEAGEDLVLRHRIESAGFRFVMADFAVAHKYPTSLSGNLRRFNRYGRGAIHVKRQYPDIYLEKYSLTDKWASTIAETLRFLIPGRERRGVAEHGYRLLKRCAYTVGYVQGRIIYARECGE